MSGPKSQRLLVVWVVLALLLGGVAFLQSGKHEDADDGHGHAVQNRDLLPLPVAELGAIEIAVEGKLHRFERDSNGTWFYHGAHAQLAAGHGHATDPLLAERMTKSFNALDSARMEREAPFDKDSDRFGVVAPYMILIVYKPSESQPLAQYAIGDLAPDDLVRYVHLVGTQRVVTLPQYHVDNLLGVIQAASAAVPLELPAMTPSLPAATPSLHATVPSK